MPHPYAASTFTCCVHGGDISGACNVKSQNKPGCNSVCVSAPIHIGTRVKPRCVRVRYTSAAKCMYASCRDGNALLFAHTHSRERIRIELRYELEPVYRAEPPSCTHVGEDNSSCSTPASRYREPAGTTADTLHIRQASRCGDPGFIHSGLVAGYQRYEWLRIRCQVRSTAYLTPFSSAQCALPSFDFCAPRIIPAQFVRSVCETFRGIFPAVSRVAIRLMMRP